MDKRIGAQFYTIRDYIQNIDDFDKSCKKIAQIGYKTVQISGTLLKAKEMREILDKYNLQALTSHRSFNDFLNNVDEIIEYNKTLGIELCGIGIMPGECAENTCTLSKFIDQANKICEILKKENMLFGYHNHAMEFRKFDNKNIIDFLIEETDPETFKFIADVYWLQVGGKNPAEFIEKLGNRAMAIHYKDYIVNNKKWDRAEMTEIGNGNLDWDTIITACENAGARWAFVEQDVCPGNPFDSLQISYEYLSKKGFY